MGYSLLIIGLDEKEHESLRSELQEHHITPQFLTSVEAFYEAIEQNPEAHSLIGSAELGGELFETLKSREGSLTFAAVESFEELGAEEAYDFGVPALFLKPIDSFRVTKSIESLVRLKGEGRLMRPPRYWAYLKGCLEGNIKGAVQNISRGGFGMVLAEPPGPVGRDVQFEIAGEKILLSGSAVIRWTFSSHSDYGQETCAGFEFSSLDSENQAQLETLLQASQEHMIFPVFS